MDAGGVRAAGPPPRLASFSTVPSASATGRGYYEGRRERFGAVALVGTGRKAGRSLVHFTGLRKWEILRRDFITALLEARFVTLAAVITVAYVSSFLLFALLWYAVDAARPGCVANSHGRAFAPVFVFTVVTQLTIGYGVRNLDPECSAGVTLLVVQMIIATFLDAACLGLIFARITNPLQRKHSIFISDSACLAMRDGTLKFMFRVGDVKQRQVILPVVRAFLYTWEPRDTFEGEHIPIRVQALDIEYVDGMMLLPVTIEHVVDERSPLYGHSASSLNAVHAEVVVTFEGQIDSTGLSFMARQSYLASEVRWGCVFKRIIHKAGPGAKGHTVDMTSFHQIEAQPCFEGQLLTDDDISVQVLRQQARGGRVPYPSLTENTLCISQLACITRQQGVLKLVFRVGDVGSRPGHANRTLNAHVRLFLYSWRERRTPEGEVLPFQQVELDVGHAVGRDRLFLRVPVLVEHIIDSSSPLFNWTHLEGRLSELDAELVAVVEGVVYATSAVCVRQQTFKARDLRWGHSFFNIVNPPTRTSALPTVDWARFHDVEKLSESTFDAVRHDDGWRRGPVAEAASARLLPRDAPPSGQ